MKADSITLFIILDAFRTEYLENAPYLASIADWKGIVREPFGFISTRPAMCAGLYPEESGLCFEYVYRPGGSTFKPWFFSALDTVSALMPAGPLRLGASTWIRATSGQPVVRRTAFVRNMPFRHLPLFDMAEKLVQTDAGYLGDHPTIYDLLRLDDQEFLYYGFARPKKGLEIFRRFRAVFLQHNFRESDEAMMDQFEAAMDRKLPSFAHLHFSACDWVGHEAGPLSDDMKETTAFVDGLVKRAHEIALRKYNTVRIVASADHGMVEVRDHHDLNDVIGDLPFKEPDDFIVWRDSTMARFWFFNDRALRAVSDCLQDVVWGRLLTDEDRSRMHIRFSDNSTGDIFFVLEPGHVLLPNYYQDKGAPPRGMHGYMPEVRENQGLILLHNPPRSPTVSEGTTLDMVDVFPTVLDMHGLAYPPEMTARSVLG